ncbi:MAG: response regulator [Planctomycetaceae bacterium]
MTTNIREIVLAAFQVEHKEQLEGIRAILADVEKSQHGLDRGSLDEVFRLAHSLKGGARVCDLQIAEAFGHRLETLFSQVRDGSRVLDRDVLKTINQVLDAIEDWMAALTQDNTPPDTAPALTAIDTLLSVIDSSEAPLASLEPKFRAVEQFTVQGTSSESDADLSTTSSRHVETVRVGAENLDRLLRASGRLLSESLYQDQVNGEMAALQRQLVEMERERDAHRRAAASSYHQLNLKPEFSRVAKYLESVDRQLHRLSRSVSQICLRQRRCSWQLRERGRQIQREARDARMVTAGSVFQGFRKMMRDLAKDAANQVAFRVEGFEVRADRLVLQALKDPLMHILRNCISHGIEPPDERVRNGKPAEGRAALTVEADCNRLIIVVEDDGKGIDIKAVTDTAVRRGILSESQAAGQSAEDTLNLVFQAGFSTTESVTKLAGRGMGLSVVQEAAKRLQAETRIESKPGMGTRVTITSPLSITTHRLLLLSCRDQTFAIPTRSIARLVQLDAKKIETVEGRRIIWFQGKPVPLEALAEVLGIGSGGLAAGGDILRVAIVEAGERHLAVSVDSFLSEREAFVQNLTGPAARKELAGAIVLEDGAVGLVLNPLELVKSRRPARPVATPENTPAAAEQRTPRILVVDDSFTTRALEKGILEANGYQVAVAVDGVDALSQLFCDEFDLVISDIEMPRMNGFELLEDLKQDVRFASVPVIMVTSRDRLEDRRRGLELGAEAYIVKRQFDHQELLTTIGQVVGDAKSQRT